jgi:hypothetical protein
LTRTTHTPRLIGSARHSSSRSCSRSVRVGSPARTAARLGR